VKKDDLVNFIDGLKSSGVKTVDVGFLQNALAQIDDGNTSDKTHEWRTLTAKLKHDSDLAAYNNKHAFNVRLFEAVITFSQLTLKSAFLLNGGASIAILTFLGHDQWKYLRVPLANALLLFVTGVFMSALSTASTYFTQSAYAEHNRRIGNYWRWVTVVLLAVAYLAFGIASWRCYIAFTRNSSGILKHSSSQVFVLSTGV
jgi:hypothetical protein